MRTHGIGIEIAICAGIAVLCGGAASALPEGWKITEFASPPDGEYPTAISAAANGDVYISSDRNGSLGHKPEFGKIVRATDTDGDGKADEFQDFVPHPGAGFGNWQLSHSCHNFCKKEVHELDRRWSF